MVERWHLDLAATALAVGLVIAGGDRWAGVAVRRFTIAAAGLTGAVLGAWGNQRAWPWLAAAAVLALWPDNEDRPHPLGPWTVTLAVVSLAGVWSAVPDTEPPLAAGCVMVGLGLNRWVSRRPVGPAGTAALVVSVLGSVWVGSAGWGAAMASACAVGMVLCAPVAAGFTARGIRPTGRGGLIGAHLVVALVVPRAVMGLDARAAAAIAASVMVALVVVAGAVVVHDRRVDGRTGSVA